jgi:hypothetical protein
VTEEQIQICAHAEVGSRYGNAISVDSELQEDAEELVEKGWLRAAEGEEGETGYALTDTGRVALYVSEHLLGAYSGN